jgi:RNA polymerase sigma-70 factor, ECF subfamily
MDVGTRATRPHLECVAAADADEQARPLGSKDLSDDALMLAAAEGDRHAFAELVARYQQTVRRLCGVLLRDETLARDVAQEVFLRLWRARGKYRPEGKFRQFIFAIARNGCASARVSRSRQVAVVTALATWDAADEIDPHAVIDRGTVVRGALAKLDDKFRVPLMLRFFVGLSHEEIAAAIGRTTSAARSRVFYGLKELAQLLPEEV